MLYDSAFAHVDAVMRVPSTRRHDVRTEGWLTPEIERVIAGPHLGKVCRSARVLALGAACCCMCAR
jgi:hypothetical protein